MSFRVERGRVNVGFVEDEVAFVDLGDSERVEVAVMYDEGDDVRELELELEA